MSASLAAADSEATIRLGEALGRVVEPGDVIVLSGDLGAGKTTFVQGAARALGVCDRVTSPTFTILHVHQGRVPLVHVDLYRIGRLSDVVDLDLDDLLYGDGATFVEWGDRFPELFGRGGLTVEFHYADGGRALEVSAESERGERLLDRWVSACSA